MKTILIMAFMLFAFSKASAQKYVDTNMKIFQFQPHSVRYGRTVYRDTIPDYALQHSFTLRSENGGGMGLPENPDTLYCYNHFGYIYDRALEELNYWRKFSDDAYLKYTKTHNERYYEDHLTGVRRTEYWGGVWEGMRLLMYQWYAETHFSYEFHTKR